MIGTEEINSGRESFNVMVMNFIVSQNIFLSQNTSEMAYTCSQSGRECYIAKSSSHMIYAFLYRLRFCLEEGINHKQPDCRMAIA